MNKFMKLPLTYIRSDILMAQVRGYKMMSKYSVIN